MDYDIVVEQIAATRAVKQTQFDFSVRVRGTSRPFSCDIPILVCGTFDDTDPSELTFRARRELLEILRKIVTAAENKWPRPK